MSPPEEKSVLLPYDPANSKRQLLTPFVILGLLVLSILAWLSCLDSVQHFLRKHKSTAVSAPVPQVPPDLKPDRVTLAFQSAAVPLGRAAPPIYLYVSPTTKRHLRSVGGDYTLLVSPWSDFLRTRQIAHNVTSRLADLPPDGQAVLVLPSSVALNDSERQQIQAFQKAGGSILATWSTGTVDEHGQWQGDDFLHQLFGLHIAGELGSDNEARFLNLFGETPLTMGYPAGLRIWLNNVAEPALKFAGSRASAIYTDWIRSTDGSAPGSAILYDEYGPQRAHARWVAIGFSETAWAGQEKELAGLLENALHWLARGTTLAKSTWPAPYQAAYLIEMDTEDGFANARYFADMMDEAGLPATFYSLTSEAVRYPNLVRYLSKRHEIAYHGDVHIGFRGQPETQQRERLIRMQTEMYSILGNSNVPTGFRAPEEKYDKMTEKLLRELGFRHHAADPARTDARVPIFVAEQNASPQQSLVVLPRTQHDDIGMRIGHRPDHALNEVLESLIRDFDDARSMGALGLLSVHSQYFGKNGLLHALFPSFLRHVLQHREQVWIATGHDISEWWQERERMHYRVNGHSGNFTVEVNVEGSEPLSHGVLVVSHRGANVPVVVESVQGARFLPQVSMLDAYRSALIFDNLPAGRHLFAVKLPQKLKP